MCLMKFAYALLKSKYKHARVKYKRYSFSMLIADSFLKQALGLMYRSSIGDREGMLFIFRRSARYGIWMHGMKFAIDIVWLDSDKRVIDTVDNAKPCAGILTCKTYTPSRPAMYVLEMNSGIRRKLGMRIGDKVSFSSQ
ncbi:MAG: DUF192 domain-containing protein [Candidatus Micrarchaeaceae archaeon]